MKIKYQREREYGFEIFLTPGPHQFRFKIDECEEKIVVHATPVIQSNIRYFTKERLILEGDKLFWFYDKKIDRDHYWTRVDKKIFKRKFKRK